MVESNAKSMSKNEGWGMGLFFIFFHNHPPLHDNDNDNDNNNNNNINNNSKVSNFNSKIHSNRKRSYFTLPHNSSSNLLVSKTQSTLSICGLLVFTTFLLFALLPFQPSPSVSHYNAVSRRLLPDYPYSRPISKSVTPALQGMGQLYLKGSKSMSDLIVGHLSEHISGQHIRSFIRVVVHSGLLSRVDLVFLFASPAMLGEFGDLVKSECDSVRRLVQLGGQIGRSELGFGLTRYFRAAGEGGKEALWGRRVGGSNLTSVVESTRPSYGSVVGFDSSELDPEDSLSGFLDHVPMSLRRWACYPMLLGRLRRNFKHVLLADVAGSLILSDPFTRVRNHSSESVYLWSNPNSVASIDSSRHGKKARNQEQLLQLSPGVIVGGSRGVRRLANAALTEIVRRSMEHKGKNKNSVTESGLVNQLVHSKHLMKGISLMTPTEFIPDSGSLSGFNSVDSSSSFLALSNNFSVIKRGNSSSFDVDEVVTREICLAHKLFSSLYSDCLVRQHH